MEEGEGNHVLTEAALQVHLTTSSSSSSTDSSAPSHSPITLSLNGSDAGSAADGDDSVKKNEGGGGGGDKKKFKPLTFYEVEQSLDKYYEDTASTEGELDILITYLKGQKNLHMQSKMVAEQWLNVLLLPTLMITSAITIFAPFIQTVGFSGGLISGLNATTAFLISLVKYLKLESMVETFHQTVNQYDKLETGVEFTTSKLLFVTDAAEKSRLVLDKIQEIEKKVSEIKEWNSLLVPAVVVRAFPVICNVNIFSFIKRIEGAKRSLVAKFKDVKNEIRYIEYKMGSAAARGGGSDFSAIKYSRRLEHLNEVKDKIKEELMHHRQAYCHIDQIFTREIRQAQQQARPWFFFAFSSAFYAAAAAAPVVVSNNPVVDRFLVQQQNFIVTLT